MNRHRKIVESIKKQFIKDLEDGKETYIRAVIRQIDYEFRQYAKDNTEIILTDFAKRLVNKMNVPASVRASIGDELQRVQLQISETWKEYFETETGKILTDREVTNLLSSYEIDFGSIDNAETVERLAKQAVNKGTGYNELRSELSKTSLGFSQVNTLANTAVAQFDNAVHIENAIQAGVTYYLYDGIKHTNSRPFCKDRVDHVYTLDELRAMDNGQGLSVVTSLGGYNCTHYITALVNYVRRSPGELFTESHFREAA
jgi:hypothetical protein